MSAAAAGGVAQYPNGKTILGYPLSCLPPGLHPGCYIVQFLKQPLD